MVKTVKALKKRKYKFTKKRKKALKKARRKWMRMPSLKRRKAMPGRGKPKKVYPTGQYMALDVGRKRHHYIFVKKVKYGWKKVKPPKGVRMIKKGKYKGLVTHRGMVSHVGKARRAWMKKSSVSRKRAMPERKGRKGYKRVTRYITRKGKRIRTHQWVKK